MDREANERRKEKVNNSNDETLLKTLLKIIDNDHQKLMANIDDSLNSRWIGKSEKTTLEISKVLLNMIARLNKHMISNLFSLDNMQKRLKNVEIIVQNITEKVEVDLSSIKAEVDALKKAIKRPIFDQLDRFIQDYKKAKEERQKSVRKKKGDYCV